jgi:hypothetical protein
MKLLSEDLYQNNVLFSYYGFIDNSVLNHVLSIAKTKLAQNKESVVVINRVYNTINESIENIIKHNFFPDQNMLQYKSLLLIVSDNGFYEINTVNVINEKQKEKIDSQLSAMSKMSKDELKIAKSSILSNKLYSEVATAGLGLIDMFIKTDAHHFGIAPYKENYLFKINFKVNKEIVVNGST